MREILAIILLIVSIVLGIGISKALLQLLMKILGASSLYMSVKTQLIFTLVVIAIIMGLLGSLIGFG